jgi:hypothetical protein
MPQSQKGHLLLTNAVKTGRTCVQAHLTQPLTQARSTSPLLLRCQTQSHPPHPPFQYHGSPSSLQSHNPLFFIQDAELIAEVVITVVERLDLEPSLVYIVPQQEITYFVRRNLAEAVSAAKSNTPYSLRVDNSTVATSKASLGTVQGKVIGSTIVRLEDDGAPANRARGFACLPSSLSFASNAHSQPPHASPCLFRRPPA